MRWQPRQSVPDPDPIGAPFTGANRWLGVSFRSVTCNLTRATTPMADRPKSSREKVRAYRERLRRQGLRPIQIWVPDVRSRKFKAEAHRQSAAVAESPHAREDQEFVDAASDFPGA